ncbi:hypothetical protein [Nonomuraea cavernae]|uniref:hypothetical protein n=1 Tax=Nonomuraea cavernae TaxID=2045107 RepID=UPI0033DBA34C
MTELISEFSERQGISDFFGVADAGVEEGDFASDATIWDTGRPGPNSWIDVGPNGVTLSVEQGKRTYVRYELWDGPPLPMDSSWGRSWEGELFLASGRIVAVSYAGDEPDYYIPFDLGRQGANWLVRICAKTPKNETDPEFPSNIYGADLFKLQFWLPRP